MLSNKQIGELGEAAAVKYLKKHGYFIIARNYAVVGGEIDIAAWSPFKLVIFEVKTRSNSIYGTGREAVTRNKQKRIKKTAAELISAHCQNGYAPYYLFSRIPLYLKFFSVRYDIIEIDSNNKYKLNAHIKNAF